MLFMLSRLRTGRTAYQKYFHSRVDIFLKSSMKSDVSVLRIWNLSHNGELYAAALLKNMNIPILKYCASLSCNNSLQYVSKIFF